MTGSLFMVILTMIRTGNFEMHQPSSYAISQWYDPSNVLSSVREIYHRQVSEDDLLSSIYNDILHPVIKESVKRKKENVKTKIEAANKYYERLRVKSLKEKQSERNIMSNFMSLRTQQRVGKGFSILRSSVPHYQALLKYLVYIIGGTLVMSLPAVV